MSDAERLQREIDGFNNTEGDLKYYDCAKCRNRGFLATARNGEIDIVQCDCYEVRKSARLLVQSGINADYTLENYKASEAWQKNILQNARKFLDKPEGWFFVGGQVGSGKSHICTGIVRKLIDKGIAARYMLWRDDSTKIKASVKYPEDYTNLVEPLKEIPVLYIDDFFKTNSGEPTTADVNLAFEILNARYNRKDLITIISSEFFLDELIEIDQAVGSRVFERCHKWQHNIARKRERNYRLRREVL